VKTASATNYGIIKMPLICRFDQTTTRPQQVDQTQLYQTTTGANDKLTKRQLDQNQLDQKIHLHYPILRDHI
jgi:hypothetical protein